MHFNRKISRLVVLGVITVILGIYSINLVLLAASFYLTYKIVNKFLSWEVFSSLTFRLLISALVTITLCQSLIVSYWILLPNFPLSTTPWLLFGFCLVAYGWAQHFLTDKPTPKPAKLARKKILSYHDIISLTIAAVLTVIMVIGPLRTTLRDKGSLETYAVQLMDLSIDDSNHLSRINDRLQLDRGVLYKTDQEKYVALSETISSYPAGWHSANVVLAKSLVPGLSVGSQSLVAYVIMKIVWMFILFFLFSELLCILASKISPKKSSLSLWVWIVGAALYFGAYMLIEQFYQGFFSFIPELIALIMGALFLIQRATDPEENVRTFWLMVSAATAATLSWILTLPGFAIIMLISFFSFSNRKALLSSTRAVFTHCWRFLPIIALSALSIGVQAYLIMTTSYRSFAQGINDPGGIYTHSAYYILFIIVGVLLALALTSGTMKKVNVTLSAYIASLMVFATFIYFFQMATIHHIDYYTHKIFNTVLIIAVPVAIIGFAQLIYRIQKESTPALAAFVSLGLILALPLTIGIEPTNAPQASYILGKRSLSTAQASAVISSIESRSKTSVGERSDDAIVFNDNDFIDNVFLSNMLRTIKHTNDCTGGTFSAVFYSNFPEILRVRKVLCNPNEKLTIITNSKTVDSLKSQVSAAGLYSKITFVVAN